MTLGAAVVKKREDKDSWGLRRSRKEVRNHLVGRITYSFDQQKVG